MSLQKGTFYILDHMQNKSNLVAQKLTCCFLHLTDCLPTLTEDSVTVHYYRGWGGDNLPDIIDQSSPE